MVQKSSVIAGPRGFDILPGQHGLDRYRYLSDRTKGTQQDLGGLLLLVFSVLPGGSCIRRHAWLVKPGRLTPEEFEKMKIHPVVGAEILERVRFPYPVVPIVRAHHEKWDGSGYPFGLKGTDIPIGARILSAVDFLDAMASDRQYRRA